VRRRLSLAYSTVFRAPHWYSTFVEVYASWRKVKFGTVGTCIFGSIRLESCSDRMGPASLAFLSYHKNYPVGFESRTGWDRWICRLKNRVVSAGRPLDRSVSLRAVEEWLYFLVTQFGQFDCRSKFSRFRLDWTNSTVRFMHWLGFGLFHLFFAWMMNGVAQIG